MDEFLSDESYRVFESDEKNSEQKDTDEWWLTKEMIKKVGPIIIDTGLLYGTNFASTLMISRLGVEYLAASTYIIRFKNLFLVAPGFIFYSLQPLLVDAFKASPEEPDIISPGLIIASATLLAVPVSVFSMTLLSQSKNILTVLNQNQEHVDIIEKYFTVFIWAVPPYMLLQIISQILLTSNRTSTLIPLTLLRVLLDTGLSAVLLFLANFGFLSWPIGNLIQYWGTVIVVAAVYLFYGKKLRAEINFSGQYFFKEICSTIYRLLKLGIPIAGQISVVFFSSLLCTLFIGNLSEEALVAFNITTSINSWSTMLLDPFSSVVSVLIANEKAFKKIYVLATKLSFILCVPISLCLIFAHHGLTSLYLEQKEDSNNKVFLLNSSLMPIYSVAGPAFALKSIATGILRGIHQTTPALLAEVIGSMIVGLPGAACFAFSQEKSLAGIGASEVFGGIVSMLIVNLSARRLTYAQSAKCCFFKNTFPQEIIREKIINPIEKMSNENQKYTEHNIPK